MESFEVQAKSKLGWQIVAVFDGYDRAHECALQYDHDRVYDDLRVTREVENPTTGRFRATVLYRCGQKVRDEIARKDAEDNRATAYERRRQRLNKTITPRWVRKSDKERARKRSRSNPLRLAIVGTLLLSAGMAAVYYFEFILFGK